MYRLITVLLLAAALPAAASAQTLDTPSRSFGGGLHGVYGAPQGEFSNYVNNAWGLGGFLAWTPPEVPFFGLRLDGGFMNYGQGIGIGFWIGLISSVISSIFNYIYAKFIDPTFITTIREKAIEDMEAKGQSQEQIDAAMKFIDMFTSAEAILFFGLFFGILFTIIVALVISIFTQKPRAETI